jgi:hypothetical protein
MVQLLDSDITTREVLGWKGLHLLHYMGSSCSQNLRIFLNPKGLPWESHLVDLSANENLGSWGSIHVGLCPCWCTMVRCISKATT